MPSDGKAATPLAVKGATGEAYRPSYSPDGAWITYTLRHEGRNDVHVWSSSAVVTVSARPDPRPR